MKKNLIYLTAFFCGMSVMAVELSATRLLAPYFGASMIVWTVTIGIIMISMSLGNVIGGRAADRYNSKNRLFSRIWLASLWIAVIPLVGKYIVAVSVLALMWILPQNLLIAGTVISCLVIFSFPLIILGMVSPYLVKFGIKNMEESGKTTGRIYALSTIGSIIGTFIPTFLTIPFIGTNKTFLVFAFLLNLICLYYFITQNKRIIRTALSGSIILALVFSPIGNSYAFWKKTVLEEESLYNYLQVAENNNSVILSTNVAFGVQSIYMKNSLLTGLYYDYAITAPFFIRDMTFDKSLDLLILGLGTGTYAKMCKRFFPATHTTGVEIDSKIVDLSKAYFGLKDDEADIHINDGRTFLSGGDAGKYDVILLDAYHDISIPFHMATLEFFKEVKSHLKENGLIILNINMRSQENNEIIDYLTQTLKQCMNKVYLYKINTITNTLVYASDDINCYDNFISNTDGIDQSHPLYRSIRYVKDNIREIHEARLTLTDDMAPVEIMGQKVLDELVSDCISYYKSQIDSSDKGIWSIFDMLSEY